MSTVKLNSYINFNGNAAKAIEFYKSVFGGETYVDTFGGFAEKAPNSGMTFDPDEADKVMHAYLKGENGIEIMASDVPSGMPVAPDVSNVVLTLNGDDEAKLTDYWNKLSEGGNVTMPLNKAPWGDVFGMLIDKFGIAWMVNISRIATK